MQRLVGHSVSALALSDMGGVGGFEHDPLSKELSAGCPIVGGWSQGLRPWE